jgi:hypothetical protein
MNFPETSSERINFFREEYQKWSPKTDLVIEDPNGLLSNNFVCPYVTEMVSNCLNQGATKVRVEITNEGITVSDDVCHPDASIILENINSSRPKSEKWKRGELGGAGILSTRYSLREFAEGTLTYFADPEGKITAHIVWKHPPIYRETHAPLFDK